MILHGKRITEALISLRGCAGWSAPVLFANPRRQVFSRQGPIIYDLLQAGLEKHAYIRYKIYTGLVENSVDPDQLVHRKPADLDSHRF